MKLHEELFSKDIQYFANTGMHTFQYGVIANRERPMWSDEALVLS